MKKTGLKKPRSRIRWPLLVLLWIWAGLVFLVLDLFLDVEKFDGVRPGSELYRATRAAAHDMVGERPDYRRGARPERFVIRDGDGWEREEEVTLVAGRKQRSGAHRVFYEDGTKAVEGRYRNGRRDGEWLWWHTDGTLALQEHLDMGKPAGELVRYHENGNRAAEGRYVDGNRDGEWKSFQEDGSDAAYDEYVTGKRHGASVTWHANGTMSGKGRMSNDKPVGRWDRWHENGHVANRGEYRDGVRDGTWTYWTAWGKVTRQDVYTNGKVTRTIEFSREPHPLDTRDFTPVLSR